MEGMPSAAATTARLAELRSLLVEQRLETRRLRKRERYGAQRRQRPSPAVLEVAQRVIALSDGDWRLAASYLESSWRSRPLSAATAGVQGADNMSKRALDLARALTTTWEGLTAAARDALLRSATAREEQRLRSAKDFMTSQRLLHYVTRQNRKALAPSGSSLWVQRSLQRRLLARRAGHEEYEAAAAGGGLHRARSRTQWLRRWSRRHALTRGRFALGNRLSQATARAKAAEC
jgi:hypothetical protein